MTLLKDHYFAMQLDGVPEERFRTLPAAMTAVLDHPRTPGHVVYHATEFTEGQVAMKMHADDTWEAPTYPGEDTGSDEQGA